MSEVGYSGGLIYTCELGHLGLDRFILCLLADLEVHCVNMDDSEDSQRDMANTSNTRGEVDAAVALAGLQYNAEIGQLRRN